jgi:tryptophan synthase alpha subunit
MTGEKKYAADDSDEDDDGPTIRRGQKQSLEVKTTGFDTYKIIQQVKETLMSSTS